MKEKLTEQDFIEVSKKIGCDVASIKAFCEVEAPNGGFLPDGQVTILFERHVFYRLTKGKFFKTNPDVCNPKAGGYGPSGQHQHDRLAIAVKLDRESALKSCSWGKFQIMGFNYKSAGFASLQEFINSMSVNERNQLLAFVNFIINNNLGQYLRSKNWVKLAYYYNGSDYKKNNYDVKLAKAYLKYS